MNAVVLVSKGQVRTQEIAKPGLLEPYDAIVKSTAATICRTDVKIVQSLYRGKGSPHNPGLVLGHEGVGVVEEVGSLVKKVKRGDRVVVFNNTQCGTCFYCLKGLYTYCENGGFLLGNTINGVQAEYVKVPYADMGLYKVPRDLTNEQLLPLSDLAPTALFGVKNAEVRPGDSVAVFGAGAVGQSVIAVAKLFGPGQIIAVDTVDSRLRVAKMSGAEITINAGKEDCVERIRELTDGRGVEVSIEAAGTKGTYESALKALRPGGCISILGQFKEAQTLPIHEILGKNLRMHWGFCNTIEIPELIRLVQKRRLDLSHLFTHTFSLSESERAYEVFDKMLDNCIRVLIRMGVESV